MESLLESLRLALLEVRRRSLLQELRDVNQLIHLQTPDRERQGAPTTLSESRDRAA